MQAASSGTWLYSRLLLRMVWAQLLSLQHPSATGGLHKMRVWATCNARAANWTCLQYSKEGPELKEVFRLLVEKLEIKLQGYYTESNSTTLILHTKHV